VMKSEADEEDNHGPNHLAYGRDNAEHSCICKHSGDKDGKKLCHAEERDRGKGELKKGCETCYPIKYSRCGNGIVNEICNDEGENLSHKGGYFIGESGKEILWNRERLKKAEEEARQQKSQKELDLQGVDPHAVSHHTEVGGAVVIDVYG